MFVTVDKVAPGQVLESLLELHLAKCAQPAMTAKERQMPSLSIEVIGQAVLDTALTSPIKNPSVQNERLMPPSQQSCRAPHDDSGGELYLIPQDPS
jgi:hypothetical protein